MNAPAQRRHIAYSAGLSDGYVLSGNGCAALQRKQAWREGGGKAFESAAAWPF
ncbi:hypothetical protein ACTSKR_12805 [Chitinibacteraceae bacterium HSL-7]